MQQFDIFEFVLKQMEGQTGGRDEPKLRLPSSTVSNRLVSTTACVPRLFCHNFHPVDDKACFLLREFMNVSSSLLFDHLDH